ncbi:TIGR02444 family protein [Pseudoalteromonas sp.]|uniref:TIGR02444 family protein n=1 Tax=Pseudoalteromonas sp. TaxID=53249 RepID=UPI00356549DC
MNLLNSDDFWQFACDLYSKGHMQTRLLDYQNQQGKNVNLCLLLYYLDSLNFSINAEQLSQLQHVVSEFDAQVLKPLRSARGYLKANQQSITDYANIRHALLSAELKLEKQQQQMLIAAANDFELIACTTPDNSALYL